MAGDASDQDRSEAATPYKLRKAHERGSVVRSPEVTFAAVLLAATACVLGLGQGIVQGLASLVWSGLMSSGQQTADAQAMMSTAMGMSLAALRAAAPLVLVIWASATIAAALQARGVFSAQPLKPDFSRLGPAQGIARLLSIKSAFDLLRNVAKLGVLATAAAAWGRHHLADIIALHRATPKGQMLAAMSMVASVLGMAAGMFLFLAAIDWTFNRWEFARQMRMSRKEVKDERKEREGDPRIKSRLRELRLEWMRRARSLGKVKGADVLVTNPTHYAVALEYRHGESPAPVIIAKGAGELALCMRDEARRRHVPIVENPPLARALFKVQGTEPFIPAANYQDVARILRWVYATRGVRGTGSGT